jgi:Domain of unknown function (DUF3846)
MKALTLNTDGHKAIVEFDNSNAYDTLREAVGGLIEAVDLHTLGVTMWVNEEGKIEQLEQNAIGTSLYVDEFGMYDFISGNIIFTHVDTDEEGNTLGLTDEQIATLMDYTRTMYVVATASHSSLGGE